MTATTISSRRLANRAAKRDAEVNSRANRILCRAISATLAPVVSEDDFVLDHMDRKVRQSKPTDAEIAAFLRGNRVVDTADILEYLGAAAFDKIYYNGSIVRDPKHNPRKRNNLYWITTKASDIYGIPARFEVAGGTAKLIAA